MKGEQAMWTIFWTVFLVWVIGMALMPLIKYFGRVGQWSLTEDGQEYWRNAHARTQEENSTYFSEHFDRWEKDHETDREHQEGS